MILNNYVYISTDENIYFSPKLISIFFSLKEEDIFYYLSNLTDISLTEDYYIYSGDLILFLEYLMKEIKEGSLSSSEDKEHIIYVVYKIAKLIFEYTDYLFARYIVLLTSSSLNNKYETYSSICKLFIYEIISDDFNYDQINLNERLDYLTEIFNIVV